MLHILVALAGGERHGYAIMRQVEDLTGGAQRPDPATDDERRRYYRLTDRGRRAAGAVARRLEALVRAARSRRLLGHPIPGSRGEGLG